MKKLRFVAELLLLVWTMSAQTDDVAQAVRRQRIAHIDFYHVSGGAGFALNHNFCVGPQLSAGIGSFRNLLNGDFGVRYQFLGVFPRKGVESVSLQQLPVFLSLNLNVFRWKTGSLYLGGEMAFVPTVVAHHRLPAGQMVSDRQIGKNHFTPAAKLGVRVQQYDVSLFYEYDLKPSFNQKYIFETAGFDYDLLHAAIFERMRFGIRFLYHFDF